MSISSGTAVAAWVGAALDQARSLPFRASGCPSSTAPAQEIVTPLSTDMTWPVVIAASSEAR